MATVKGGPRGLVGLAVAGVLGNVIVSGLGKAVPPSMRREMVVRGFAGGIRVGRWVGEVGEETWLRLNDVVAEARSRVGDIPSESEGEGNLSSDRQ